MPELSRAKGWAARSAVPGKAAYLERCGKELGAQARRRREKRTDAHLEEQESPPSAESNQIHGMESMRVRCRRAQYIPQRNNRTGRVVNAHRRSPRPPRASWPQEAGAAHGRRGYSGCTLSEGRVEGVELVCDEHRSGSRGVDSQACGGRSKLFDDRFDQQAADSDAHLRAAATDRECRWP